MDEPLMRATPVDAVEENSTMALRKKDAPDESKPHRYVIVEDRSRDRCKQRREGPTAGKGIVRAEARKGGTKRDLYHEGRAAMFAKGV